MSAVKNIGEKPFDRYCRLAKKHFETKNYPRAIINLNKALKIDPKYSKAYYNRGLIFKLTGNIQKAIDDFSKAIEYDPADSVAYNRRSELYCINQKFDDAIRDLEKSKELDPSHDFQYLNNYGIILISKGQPEAALPIFKQALEKTNEKEYLSTVNANMGRAYLRLNKFENAIAFFDKAITLDASNIAATMSRAIAYSNLKNYDKALADFTEATNRRPDNYEAWVNFGLFYRVNKQPEKSIEKLKTAIKLLPDLPPAYFQLALSYQSLEQYDKALDQYNRLISIDSKMAHAFTHKGLVFLTLCNNKDALNNFNEAINLDSSEDTAFAGKGYCLLATGEYDEALKCFNSAIDLDPSNSWAQLGKGEALCLRSRDQLSFKQKRQNESEMLSAFDAALQAKDEPVVTQLAVWWKDFSKKYSCASEENKRRLIAYAELFNDTLEHNIFSTITDKENRLNKFITSSKTISPSDCSFQVLRRWNSFTPAIPEKSHSNLGGGYFLACNGQGNIIDPGYDFIENFMSTSHSLGDIDNIILTHAHDDHTSDFEALLSLFSKLKTEKHLRVFPNLGASVKFSNLLAKSESFFDSFEILNNNKVYDLKDCLKMKAIPAKHKDIITENSSKGLIFEIIKGRKKYKLGITGDTKYFTAADSGTDICSFYENLDVLVLHIGSIHKEEFECIEDNFDCHKYNGWHLGIRGVVNTIFRCRPKLAIISEFGEELCAIRTQIAHRLDNKFENFQSSGNVRVIPGDIGLYINFGKKLEIRCEVCGKLVQLADLCYTDTLINHKVAYHCKNHLRTEIVDKFKKEQQRELQYRAESIGCSTDFIYPGHGYVK